MKMSAEENATAAMLLAPAARRLFGYGTLMSSAEGAYGEAARSRLRREAPLRLPASTRGALYELGRYPGLVDAASADERVHGQLVLLADAAATLPWLDEYETISAAPDADNEYARRERTVTLASGRTVTAWSYVYIRPVAGLARIPGGRWRPGMA